MQPLSRKGGQVLHRKLTIPKNVHKLIACGREGNLPREFLDDVCDGMEAAMEDKPSRPFHGLEGVILLGKSMGFMQQTTSVMNKEEPCISLDGAIEFLAFSPYRDTQCKALVNLKCRGFIGYVCGHIHSHILKLKYNFTQTSPSTNITINIVYHVTSQRVGNGVFILKGNLVEIQPTDNSSVSRVEDVVTISTACLKKSIKIDKAPFCLGEGSSTSNGNKNLIKPPTLSIKIKICGEISGKRTKVGSQ